MTIDIQRWSSISARSEFSRSRSNMILPSGITSKLRIRAGFQICQLSLLAGLQIHDIEITEAPGLTNTGHCRQV